MMFQFHKNSYGFTLGLCNLAISWFLKDMIINLNAHCDDNLTGESSVIEISSEVITSTIQA